MVMSDQTVIVQLINKNCRIMNIGGLRGGHFGHGKMMCMGK